MKFAPLKNICILVLSGLTLSITSCLGPQISPELAAKLEAAEEELEIARALEQPPHLPGTYEHFITHNGYPTTMEIYRDEPLLAQASGKSPIYICLEQQRGRLYVGDRVAADWPVSTGVAGRPTPTGTYKVLEKKPDYASNLYGKIRDAKGKTINSNADVTKDAIPEGGRFDGSPMPYWQRLTWDGLGMHVGKVKAGKRLSHGCIRTPRDMAKQLYDITTFRTKVHIVDELETCYPARVALLDGAKYKDSVRRLKEAENNYAELQKLAEEEIAAQLRAEGKEVPKKAEDTPKPKEQATKIAAEVKPIEEPKPVAVAAPKPTVVKTTPKTTTTVVNPASDIGVVRPVMPRQKRSSFNIHMPLPR